MGTWGPRNFDSDTAADHLSLLTSGLIEEIERVIDDACQIEPDEYWGVAVPCNVELLCMLHGRGYVGVVLPSTETAIAWKAKYLAVWSGYIDSLRPSAEHKRRRRRILRDTFNRLIRCCRREE